MPASCLQVFVIKTHYEFATLRMVRHWNHPSQTYLLQPSLLVGCIEITQIGYIFNLIR